MPQNYLEAVRQFDQKVNPLFAFLRVRLTFAEQGKASIVMPIGPHLRQGGGQVAGGLLATLADECMAHAVLSLFASHQPIATAEMNIRYLRAADPDKEGDIIAEADVVKKGRKLVVASASVRDSSDRLLATAGGTFYVHSGDSAYSKQPTRSKALTVS
ncbi:MAG: PaaI family thioesterase [Desulfovibrio sp.]|jgi:uncharacterized protein (TIGR00369 family)|nr:PaaI family thioesterase [Desulfovibrio sp.]